MSLGEHVETHILGMYLNRIFVIKQNFGIVCHAFNILLLKTLTLCVILFKTEYGLT